MATTWKTGGRWLAACLLMAGGAQASPSIEAMGRDVLISTDAGGSINVRIGSDSQDLFAVFSSVRNTVSQIGSLNTQAADASTNIANLRVDLTELSADSSRGVDAAARVSSLVAEVSTSVESVQSLASEKASMSDLLDLQSRVAAATLRNLNCAADLLTGSIPPNSEPVHGACNLTTGSQCMITCKSGYSYPNATNLALQRPVVATNPQQNGAPEKAVDGILNRYNDSNRWLEYCNNRQCMMAIDLGSVQTISEFVLYNGYSRCQPGTICENNLFNSALCKHYFEVWEGSPNVPLSDALNSDAGWRAVVSVPHLSMYGEEHPVLNPPAQAQYVRLRIDNRASPGCPPRGARYARVYELEVLQSSTKGYLCTASGLTAVDNFDLQCVSDRRVEDYQL